MICEICHIVKNDNIKLGELVEITFHNDQAMCYRCVAESNAKLVNA